jgi:TRAP-type C4-dicarboxylate transport system permease small subunit
MLESATPWARRILELVSLVIGGIATGYLAWSACLFTYESWEFNDMAQGMLPMPLWIPQLSFAFGAVLLWVAVVDELILVLRGETPTFVRAVQERHAKGDFSSDI